MPKISIITTIYNREKYLSETIASILASSYQDFELILFDDGSTDYSGFIASEFVEKDNRIKLTLSSHIGRIPALIEASALATGEYMCVVDSDDWISENAIAQTVAVLDNKPDVGMVYTDCLYVDPSGLVLGHRRQNQIPYSRDRLLIDFICFHLRVFRKSLFEQIGGYDSNLDHAEDYDLALRLSEITAVEFIPSANYFYRRHPQTLGASSRAEQIYWCKKVIESSLKRTGDKRKIQVYIPEARFKLIND